MNKLKRCMQALLLSGAMLFSFTGCNSSTQVIDVDESDLISYYDQENNPLTCITFVSKNNVIVGHEYYGYISKKNGKIEFYDVLGDKTLKLYDGKLKDYDVYYRVIDEEILTKNQEDILVLYNGIEKEDINSLEKKSYCVWKSDDIWLLIDELKFLLDYKDDVTLEKLDIKTYFVDDNLGENKEESSLLTKNIK